MGNQCDGRFFEAVNFLFVCGCNCQLCVLFLSLIEGILGLCIAYDDFNVWLLYYLSSMAGRK